MKRLRIAVIGSPSSGKSYLLYDMIHAFTHLGYDVKELPLSYPHSSFGTFFYDTVNPMTGGMRGTEKYACRPENHYGAHLSKKGLSFGTLAVDFLNIPGEAFKDRTAIYRFFTLKNMLERKGKGLFWLSTWTSPGKHVRKLILPKGFNLKGMAITGADNSTRQNTYMSWFGIANELKAGGYTEQEKRRPVNGKYILRHITELSTDSILLTMKSKWAQITSISDGREDIDDYDAAGVFKYFYFFAYCQLATDLVICDRLTDMNNTGQLAEDMCHYMNMSGKHIPKVYLAFRGIDLFMCKPKNRIPHKTAAMRNKTYGDFLSSIVSQLQEQTLPRTLITLPENIKRRISQSCGTGVGRGFWRLLNTATPKSASWVYYLQRQLLGRNTVRDLVNKPENVLPPHVYFTATPIDADFCIYKNDEDITRFIYEEPQRKRSFLHETCEDMTRHFCFGSLQLLVDILLQNDIHLGASVRRSCNARLLYAQTKLIK